MTMHRFACGEDVLLTGQQHHGVRAGAPYEILACLPYEGSIPRYRVKAMHEAFSRVALEDIMVATEMPETTREAEAAPVRISTISAAKPGRQSAMRRVAGAAR